MSILVSKDTKVVVQGITGKQGMKIAREMIDYGTNVVAGVTPGKGGTSVDGIPVYDSVSDALRAHPDANTSLISVPRNQAKDAAYEAISSGQISLVNVLTEGIPNQDAAYIVDYAQNFGVRVIGPASVGLISPKDNVKIGAIGGNDPGVFYPGGIAIFSKSGGMCMSLALDIFNNLGYGVSIVVGIGGDRIVGTTFIDLLELIRDDPDTRLVVINGEVGGNFEEEAAEYIKRTGFPKRVVARMSGIGGEALFARGSRMGHAGAIIGEGSVGSFESKVRALESAGVSVAKSSDDLITLVEREMPPKGVDFEKAIASDQELVSISKAKLEGLKTQVRAIQTRTGLTQLRNGVPYFRGFSLPELMNKAGIPEMIYMAIKETDPSPKAIADFKNVWEECRSRLNIPEIALETALDSYKSGNSLNAACAAGLLALPEPEIATSSDDTNPLEKYAVSLIQEVNATIAHILSNDTAEPLPISAEEAYFTALAGRKPSEAEADLVRAMFVACIDHTPATPSSLAAMTSYSGGNSLKTALAAGITAMGDVHAGAGEGTARLLQEQISAYNAVVKEQGFYEVDGISVRSIEELAQYIVDRFAGKFSGEKAKIPGYGHRYYSMYGEDPRATALLKIAKEKQICGQHVELALAIEAVLKKEKSHGLCLNVDGAIGALISEMGISWRAGKATFIIPRTAGILGELMEQKAGSFFRLANESVIYTGPEPGRSYIDNI